MRRLYIKLVLWLNGYCPKHRVRKTYETYFGNGCTLCTHERELLDEVNDNVREQQENGV